MKVGINGRGIKRLVIPAAVTVVGLLLTVQPCQAVIYTVGDMGSWYGSALTGFGIDTGGGDLTVGQTFHINNGSALVSSISFPLYAEAAAADFQVGVAAWNGTQPTGSLLYLSGTLVAGGNNWQTFTLTPNNLILNQGQEYVLFLSPNAFVTTSAAYNTFVGAVGSGAYTDGQYYDVAGYHLGINDLFALSWSGAPINMAFSINYQLVPEPSPLIFIYLGSLALCLRHRGPQMRFEG
jgi:hypothetical protein